jgi:hypothetical protein
MTNWYLPLIFATSLAPMMLVVGIFVGRRRSVGMLAQLLEQGTFRIVSADGNPVSVKELASVLGAEPLQARAAFGFSLGVVLAAACVGMVLAFLALSSGD